MRIAFTIILNGLHHLQHNNYEEFILRNFNYWVVVEGAAQSTGSTCWCNNMSSRFQKNGRSVDGTCEHLEKLSKQQKNLIYITREGFWENKDYQVNQAIDVIKTLVKSCYLWEIDIDEQWTINAINEAENDLDTQGAKTGQFLCDYYVGKNLLARGEWGEGKFFPYRRLWKWRGEYFEYHEPPILIGGNGKSILLPQRFNHFSYYFEKDIIFKNHWYRYPNLHKKWKSLQSETSFPQPINRLLPPGGWGATNTIIIKKANEIAFL